MEPAQAKAILSNPASRIRFQRVVEMSAAISVVYESMSVSRIVRCPALISAAVMPAGDSGATGQAFIVTMSGSAVSLIIAFARCVSVSDRTRSRAWSSWCPRGRWPAFGPSRSSAGLVPVKVGVLTVTWPSTMVKLNERWCPSKRQPQLPLASGVPNTET